MCSLYGGNQVSVADLVALFPEPVIINEGMYSETIKNQCDLDDALKVVREKTSDCPACILAAIRQSKIYYNFDFNFQDETAAFWVDFNKENY